MTFSSLKERRLPILDDRLVILSSNTHKTQHVFKPRCYCYRCCWGNWIRDCRAFNQEAQCTRRGQRHRGRKPGRIGEAAPATTESAVGRHYQGQSVEPVCYRNKGDPNLSRPKLQRAKRGDIRDKILTHICLAQPQPETSSQLVDLALREFGRIDGLCLLAGIFGPCHRLEATGAQHWRRVLEINLLSHLDMVSGWAWAVAFFCDPFS